MDDKKVVIYSTPTCGYCKMAKSFFADNKVEYIEHNVAENEAARNEMMEKSGQGGVPVITIGDEVVVGFNEDKIKEVLGM